MGSIYPPLQSCRSRLLLSSSSSSLLVTIRVSSAWRNAFARIDCIKVNCDLNAKIMTVNVALAVPPGAAEQTMYKMLRSRSFSLQRLHPSLSID